MGKVGFLAFAGAILALLNSLDKLSKPFKITGYVFLAFCGCILFLFDLRHFFDSPYPLKARIGEVLFTAIAGDYYEQNRCWFNWIFNLYGNQFYGKEIFSQKKTYPVLLPVLIEGENATLDPSFLKGEGGLPMLGGVPVDLPLKPQNLQETRKISLHNWEISSIPLSVTLKPLDSEPLDSEEKRMYESMDEQYNETLQHIGIALPGSDGSYVKGALRRRTRSRVFTIGDCTILLKIGERDNSEANCSIEISSGGNPRPFGKLTEKLTDDGVKTLYTFLAACQNSPETGVIDLRRKFELERGWPWKNMIYSFRIQDALGLIKNNKCVLFDCERRYLDDVDDGYWVL